MEIHHFIEHNCRTRPMLAKTDKELRTSDKLADLYPAISCFFELGNQPSSVMLAQFVRVVDNGFFYGGVTQLLTPLPLDTCMQCGQYTERSQKKALPLICIF